MFELGRIEEAVTEQVAALGGPRPDISLTDLVETVGGLQREINRLGALQLMAVGLVAATEQRRCEGYL